MPEQEKFARVEKRDGVFHIILRVGIHDSPLWNFENKSFAEGVASQLRVCHETVLKDRERAAFERAKESIFKKIEGADRCQHCPDIGWWTGQNKNTGDAEQVQCEWCSTEENSLFNVIRSIKSLRFEEGK